MANLTSQNIAVAKLYTALFDRAPDADGFAFWVKALENGATLDAIARSMLGAPEALANYPAGQTSAQFVTSYYASVFGRVPDAEGLAFWSAALDAQGGAGNPAARAALTMQISSIASTPLTSKPADMSDAAYAQTVADRARFINKTEFGVYFATELKSNDVTLAKSSLALVTDNPNSLTVATNLATGIATPAPAPGPEPGLAITAADLAADITGKFAAYSYASATVNATDMTPDQLNAVAAASGKILAKGITGTLVMTSAIVDTDIAALFAKYAGTTATANTTGMTPTQVAAVIAAADKIGANGITGPLPITNALTDTDITALFAKYADLAATVDASSMSGAQLAAVAAASGKIAANGIAGMSLLLDDASIAGTVAATLLAKASGAQVVATGADTAEVTALVANLSNIATGGITGNLALPAAVGSAQTITDLFAKYIGTTATIDASGMSAAMLEAVAVAAAAGKLGAAGVRSLTLDLGAGTLTDGVITDLLSKATDAQVVTTGPTPAQVGLLLANLSHVAAGGITGTIAVDSTIADVALLFAKYGGTTATVSTTDMSASQVAAVIAAAGKIAAAGITGPLPITSALSSAEITALFDKYSGATSTVDATGMIAAQWVAVAAQTAKIGSQGITGLSLAIGDPALDAGMVGALLAKSVDAHIVVTGATGSFVTEIVNNSSHIAAGGITGDLALGSGYTSNPTDLGLVLAKYAGTSASVDATGAGIAVLEKLGLSPGQFGTAGITALTLDFAMAGMTVPLAGTLLASASNATVVGNSATASGLDTVAANFSHVGSLNGAFSLNITQLATMTASQLTAKMVTGSQVSIVGTGGNDTIDISGATKLLTVVGGMGADVITLGSAAARIGIASIADSRTTFSASDTSAVGLDRVNGFKGGVDKIVLSSAAGAYGSVTFTAGATVAMDGASPRSIQLDEGASFATLYTTLWAQHGNPVASSATTVHAYAVTVTGGSGLNGTYVIVNDGDMDYTVADLIIRVGLTSTALPSSFEVV